MSIENIELYPAYSEQMRKAKEKGYGWNIGFDQWMTLWNNSGKLELRGNTKDDYVMARIDRIKPFTPSNIVICTNSENGKNKSPALLRQLSISGQAQQLRKKNENGFGVIFTPFGEFKSSRDAAKAEDPPVSYNAIMKRTKSPNFPDYYRIDENGVLIEKKSGSSYLTNGSSNALRKVNTPLGVFDNAKLAALSHECSEATMSRWIKNELNKDFNRT